EFDKLGDGGKIMNGRCQGGVEGNGGLCVYRSSKFGVRGLTEVAGGDLGEKNIRVNGFGGGIVETAMMKGMG
ncbi:SDR family NAD(P)-dependent oxidoreductase, partial [Staphylococcus epidermidis]|uniref:SDR family NAD(P)-dependent oxidoreductase n=1 Tax=Staphylococcus epidermidis TaxID=1282 RepID=UPI00119D2FCA